MGIDVHAAMLPACMQGCSTAQAVAGGGTTEEEQHSSDTASLQAQAQHSSNTAEHTDEPNTRQTAVQLCILAKLVTWCPDQARNPATVRPGRAHDFVTVYPGQASNFAP